MTSAMKPQDLIGKEVHDSKGERIGKVGTVYVGETSHEPEWVTVKTGLFGHRESFVPLAGASTESDGLHVGVSKDVVKDAPHIDAEGRLSEDESRHLYEYYGMPLQRGSSPTMGKQQSGMSGSGAGGSGTSSAGGAGGTRGGGDTDVAAGTAMAGMAGAGAGAAGMPTQHSDARAPLTGQARSGASPTAEREATQRDSAQRDTAQRDTAQRASAQSSPSESMQRETPRTTPVSSFGERDRPDSWSSEKQTGTGGGLHSLREPEATQSLSSTPSTTSSAASSMPSSTGSSTASTTPTPISRPSSMATSGADTSARTAGDDATRDHSLLGSKEGSDVTTERVERGRMRVRKYVVTEPKTITVQLQREEVRIEREPIGDSKSASQSSQTSQRGVDYDIAQDGEEIVLYEERLVITKERVPVERFRLQAGMVTDREQIGNDSPTAAGSDWHDKGRSQR